MRFQSLPTCTEMSLQETVQPVATPMSIPSANVMSSTTHWERRRRDGNGWLVGSGKRSTDIEFFSIAMKQHICPSIMVISTSRGSISRRGWLLTGTNYQSSGCDDCRASIAIVVPHGLFLSLWYFFQIGQLCRYRVLGRWWLAGVWGGDLLTH